MDTLKPKDHAEAVALFRSEIVGGLTRRDLDRGELRHELRLLAKKRYRAPGSKLGRSFSVPTLERWYYRYKRGGLAALRPGPRSDRGRARDLTDEQRQLLLDIRAEYRSASVPLILRTLVTEGRLEQGVVSRATVRRLYVAHGLDRIPLRDGASPKTRLRWQAEQPGALWHADVCHGPSVGIGKDKQRVRIHAILDDASRYVLALEALPSEREVDMLHLMVRALRKHGGPDVLYLDNGSTYSGNILRLGCERLAITLLHAAPYDPEARGKMERFWRTLREQCLAFMGGLGSLHDINVRLWAWLDQHYHRAPHAGLLGRTPAAVWTAAEGQRPDDHLDDDRIRDALTVRERRRVRRDTTLSVAGHTFQLDQGFLAGRVVTIAYCVLDEPPAPVVEEGETRYDLHPVDPVANAHRRRPPRHPTTPSTPAAPTGFNPPQTLLDVAVGRLPRGEQEDVP